MDRRDFLKKIGIGIGGITFLPQISLAETLHIYLNGELLLKEDNFDKETKLTKYLENFEIVKRNQIPNGQEFILRNNDNLTFSLVERKDLFEKYHHKNYTTNKLILNNTNIHPNYLINNFPRKHIKANHMKNPRINSLFSRKDIREIERLYNPTFSLEKRLGEIQLLIDNAEFYHIPRNIIPIFLAHIKEESQFISAYKNYQSDAVGLGQFVKRTGNYYGLSPNQRFNPIRNADATTRYFMDLLENNRGNPKGAIGDYVGKNTDYKQYLKHIRRVEMSLPQMQDLYSKIEKIRGQRYPYDKNYIFESDYIEVQPDTPRLPQLLYLK